MIDRKIKVIEKDSFYWTVDIDGHIIKLSRHLKKQQGGLDLGNEENIRYLLKIIEDSFIWRQTFKDARDLISGSNLLIILDTLYQESTIELFEFLYRKQLEISRVSFRKFFYSVFFVYHDTHYISKTQLPGKLSSIARTISFRPHNPNEFCQDASNAAFCVRYISTDNNIAMFTINDFDFEICLSGRPYMRDANAILQSISILQSALNSQNRTALADIIESIGNLACIRIMQICYPQLAIGYFVAEANERVSQRQYVYPNLILKNYFHTIPYRGEARTFYYEILKTLERNLPHWNNQLVSGNSEELLSNKKQYTLYYYSNLGALCSNTILIIGSEPLQKEQRQYLLCRATDAFGNIDVKLLRREGQNITYCLDILYNHLDVYFDSIANLTRFDVQLLISYFVQNTNLSYVSIQRSFCSLRVFYKFVTGISNSNQLSAFYHADLPQSLAHPTAPLSAQAKAAIMQALHELPLAVQIGIKISCCTGLRAGSFNSLTEASVVFRNGKALIRVFLKKTYKYRVRNNLPAYVDYFLPKELCDELKSFIEETRSLRSELDKPLLLVYHPINWRTDTYRKPRAVSADTVGYYMSRILAEAHVETLEGLPERASLRSVRAEIGRSLFSEGKNAQEVSEYLGNSPMVAQTHYDNYLPIDDAKMYDVLWQETIEKGIAACSKPKIVPHPVMYGTCVSQKECSGKDCRKCPSLIQCKGGDSNDICCAPAPKQ